MDENEFPRLRLLRETKTPTVSLYLLYSSSQKGPRGVICATLSTAPMPEQLDMPKDERVVHTPVRHKRSLPASYIDGAVSIGIPKNPSTPVDKSRRRSAHFIPLYTGRPIESDNESRNEALPSSEYELSV